MRLPITSILALLFIGYLIYDHYQDKKRRKD